MELNKDKYLHVTHGTDVRWHKINIGAPAGSEQCFGCAAIKMSPRLKPKRVFVLLGHICHCLQRTKQTHREPGGSEGDPSGARGGSALHRYQRGYTQHKVTHSTAILGHTITNELLFYTHMGLFKTVYI